MVFAHLSRIHQHNHRVFLRRVRFERSFAYLFRWPGHSFRRPYKEASDLGLPFVGVGFLYPQGYFHQRITREGLQEATYDKLHFSDAAGHSGG